MDTAQHTESIKSLVENVAANSISLPEFQRDFVWEITKSYDLFDSLIKDIFIGSIIYGIPSFEITVREIDTRPRRTGGSRKRKLKLYSYTKEEIDKKVKVGTFRLLLDGQQRVTSIYRALKGIDSVWIIIKNESELNEGVRIKPIGDRTLEEVLYEVTGKESSDRLSIKLSNVYDMLEGKTSREKDKATLLAETDFCKKLNLSDVSSSEVFDLYLTISNKIQDLFKSEKLVSYYMLNTDADKFSLFFERSNSKGIQLDFIDILAAKVYSGFNLRDAVEAFQDEHSGYILNREVIVRTIAFIVSNGKDIDRAFILSNLNYNHFKDHWATVCKLYISSYGYLINNHFLLSQSWIPYENLLVPLMIFLRELPSNDFSQINEFQAMFLKYWYWSSIFGLRYSGATNEITIDDAKLLREIARGKADIDKTYLNKFIPQISTSNDLLDISKRGNAIYKGVLNLINYHSAGLVDLKSTNKLSFDSKLEEHHIFPRDFLKSKYEGDKDDKEYVDSVANKMLIPKLTNIKISNRVPSSYFNEIKDSDNSDIEKSLESHLIPLEILNGSYDDCFRLFLEDRSSQIYSVFKNEILSLKQGFEVDTDEVEAEGRNL
jgi:hypothetical protein